MIQLRLADSGLQVLGRAFEDQLVPSAPGATHEGVALAGVAAVGGKP